MKNRLALFKFPKPHFSKSKLSQSTFATVQLLGTEPSFRASLLLGELPSWGQLYRCCSALLVRLVLLAYMVFVTVAQSSGLSWNSVLAGA